MDRGAWRATVHGVAKSQTQRSAHACTHVSVVTSGGSAGPRDILARVHLEETVSSPGSRG